MFGQPLVQAPYTSLASSCFVYTLLQVLQVKSVVVIVLASWDPWVIWLLMVAVPLDSSHSGAVSVSHRHVTVLSRQQCE